MSSLNNLKLFIFILLMSFNSHAIEAPRPNSILSIDDFISQFRDVLKKKVKELKKSYIIGANNTSIIYTSNKDIHCIGEKIISRNTISKIQLSISEKTGIIKENASYFGCSGVLELREEITTTGTDLKPVNWQDFIEGKRSFRLENNMDSRVYRFSNPDNSEIFSYAVKKVGNLKTYQFKFLGKSFLTYDIKINDKYTEYRYVLKGVQVAYIRKYSRFHINSGHSESRFNIRAYNSGVTKFFNGSDGQVSENVFQEKFNEVILDPILNNIGNIISYHMHAFPNTEPPKNIGAGGRILEELKLAFIRLLNNKELNLVKNLVQEYIDAIEKGELSFEGKRTEALK